LSDTNPVDDQFAASI